VNSPNQKIKDFVRLVFKKDLYPHQVEFITNALAFDRNSARWCRQTGKSTSVSLIALLFCMQNPGKKVLIVAPRDEHVGELFDKIREHAFIADEQLHNIKRITKRSLELINDSEITAITTGEKGLSIRGKTADLLIIEEAAFVKQKIYEEVLRPTILQTRGKIIEISTPWGKQGFFYKHSTDPLWKHIHVPYKKAIEYGIIDSSDLEAIKQETDELVFKAEYEAEFISAANNFFNPDSLMDAISDQINEITESTLSVIPVPEGEYYLGVDLARTGNDKTVFIVMKKDPQEKKHEIVFIKEFSGVSIDKSTEYALFLNEKFKFKKIYADETGMGGGFVDFLSKDLNSQMYRKTESTLYPRTRYSSDIVVGVTFTNKSKMELFSHLKILLEKRQIKYFQNKKLLYELGTFEYELMPDNRNLKLHHPDVPNAHDDYVDALALAVQGTRTNTASIVFADEITY